jgi:hypothetical protein
MDAACWALDLQAPENIEPRAAGYTDSEIVPHGSMVFYHYGARGDKPPVKVVWYDGGLAPERPAQMAEDDSLGARGVMFVGDKGVMVCGGAGGRPRLIPESRMDTYKRPAPTLPRSGGHHRDWLDACKGGKPASANFEYGAKLTELTLLGILALRMGTKIYWDAPNMRLRNNPAANPIINGTYRKGWEVV